MAHDLSGPAPLPLVHHLTADMAALGSIIGWVAGILPAIATLLACIWYGTQLWLTWRAHWAPGKRQDQ